MRTKNSDGRIIEMITSSDQCPLPMNHLDRDVLQPALAQCPVHSHLSASPVLQSPSFLRFISAFCCLAVSTLSRSLRPAVNCSIRRPCSRMNFWRSSISLPADAESARVLPHELAVLLSGGLSFEFHTLAFHDRTFLCARLIIEPFD